LVTAFVGHLKNVITNKYESHCVTHAKHQFNYSTQKAFSVFTSRYLVAASMADVPLPLNSRPDPTSATNFSFLTTAVPNLSYQLLLSHNCNSQTTQQLNCQSSVYIPDMDLTENVSFIIACFLVAGEMCPQSCFIENAVLLLPVYRAVT
jgi:hypothetical protein